MKMIVACCKNMGIGYKNKIPWHLPPDLKYFKKLTCQEKNSTIVMGKNTWESLNTKPLPKRKNIILSKSLNQNDVSKYKNTFVFKNIPELTEYITEKKDPVWIIGGENIYAQFIHHPQLNEIYLTRILGNYKVDTHFPDIPKDFKVASNISIETYKNILYTFSKYKKEI
jgi:dihydrofolate reductase